MDARDSTKQGKAISRRRFLGTAAAATAGAAVWPAVGCSPGVLSSRRRAVRIGTISYSFRSMPGSAEQILGYLVDCGLSHVELMDQPILQYVGQPTTDSPPQNRINQMTDPEQREAAQRARDAYNEELRRWYASPPLERFEALRRMYANEGVSIHLAKFQPGANAERADFAFRAANALGAVGVTNEIGEAAAQVMGPAAARHGQKAVFHNHGQPADPDFPGFDHFLEVSPANSLNFDFGHYYGYTGRSPVPTILRLHDRMTSFHVKDRAAPLPDGRPGPNMPFGEGTTPIAEILRLVQREGYPIYCDIELEYPIPAGSNAIEEVRKCAEFCRAALG